MDTNDILFERHPDPIWIYEVATLRILAVNAAAIARYGYPREAFLAMTIADIRPPEDVPALQRNLAQLRPRQERSGPWRHRLRSGEIIHVEITSDALAFEGRQARLVIARDVTAEVRLERERADLMERERALRRVAETAAAQFRSIFEAVPGRFLVLTPGDYEIVTASDAYLAATMTRRESVVGRRLFEVFPEDPQDPGERGVGELRASLRRVEAGGIADVMPIRRYPIPRPAEQGGGFEERWWSVVNTPVADDAGGVAFIIHRVKDLTSLIREGGDAAATDDGLRLTAIDVLTRSEELQAANLRLQEQAANLRTAQRLLGLGIWKMDPATGGLAWSDDLYAMYGVERGSFTPTFESYSALVHPDDREAVVARYRRFAQSGGRYFEFGHRLVRPDGEIVHVRGVGELADTPQGRMLTGVVQDVTDLVGAEARSESLARRLHETLEHISDALFTLDDGWRFTFLNARAETLLGRERDRIIGQSIWAAFPEIAGTVFEREVVAAVAGGRTARFTSFVEPLGRWLETTAYPSADELAVHVRDVTSERARDEQLRLLDAAVARQNDILLITEAEPIDGPEGPRIIYVNDAFVRLTGYAREAAIGRTPRFLQGPATRRSELDRIRAAMVAQEPVRVELINYAKDGTPLWLELEVAPLNDEAGRCTHFVAVERDITARKRAEQALRISEERFRLIARATHDVIWDVDVAAGTLSWTENMLTVYGHDPAAFTSGRELWFRGLHPEDRDRVEAGAAAALAGTGALWTDEYRFIRSDGSVANVVDRGFIIRDERGAPLRMLGSMMDVTEQRRLDERLRQAQKLEAIGLLTGGVAHDFNNLLTVIMGGAEVLSEEIADAELRSLAEMTVAAARRGAELTNRLLAFARRQPLAPRRVDLGELTEGLEGLLRRTLSAAIEIRVTRRPDLWATEIDPGQLESAVLNLAINARDAMPTGGRITIETANAVLGDAFADAVPGDYVMVAVSDTGTGMSPETLARAFEPFFTTKEAGRGSGLGLSMVYGFARQSGGHVQIYSELGQGTTVRMYFPRTGEQADTVPEAAPATPLEGGTEHILVVEDDPLVRRNLTGQLHTLGYRVTAAQAGAEALAILDATPDIALLLSDVVMPGGMNGAALAAAATARWPGLRVLYTSGYAEDAIVHHGRLDPGVELLAKPYRRQELAAKVRQVLDGVGERPATRQ